MVEVQGLSTREGGRPCDFSAWPQPCAGRKEPSGRLGALGLCAGPVAVPEEASVFPRLISPSGLSAGGHCIFSKDISVRECDQQSQAHLVFKAGPPTLGLRVLAGPRGLARLSDPGLHHSEGPSRGQNQGHTGEECSDSP